MKSWAMDMNDALQLSKGAFSQGGTKRGQPHDAMALSFFCLFPYVAVRNAGLGLQGQYSKVFENIKWDIIKRLLLLLFFFFLAWKHE